MIEPYIYTSKYDTYRVTLERKGVKISKNFKTKSQAKKFRNEVLDYFESNGKMPSKGLIQLMSHSV